MFAGGLNFTPSAPFEELLCESLQESLPECPHESAAYDDVPLAYGGVTVESLGVRAVEKHVAEDPKTYEEPMSPRTQKRTQTRLLQQPMEVEGVSEQAGYPSASDQPAMELLVEEHEETEQEAVETEQEVADRQAALDATKNAWRKLVAESWAELKEIEKNGQKKGAEKKEADQTEKLSEGSKKGWSFWGKSKSSDGAKSEGKEGAAAASNSSKANNGKHEKNFDVPQTFKEMTILNANMTGANLSFIKAIESSFEEMVSSVANGMDGQLELQANMCVMRLHKDVQGAFRLSDFKLCMLASLRSLLPKSWSIAHEQAWIQLWDKTEAILTANMGLPAKYEKAVDKLVNSMSPEEKSQFGLNAFNRLFDAEPHSEDHFKTSNARLSMLAGKSLELSMQMYKEPTRVMNEVTSLGLRHIMYNIPTAYFEPFVQGIVDEIRCFTDDEEAIEGVEWTMTQIACIMVYTIDTGSTPLLRAVVSNDPKMVRKALGNESRKNRAAACL